VFLAIGVPAIWQDGLFGNASDFTFRLGLIVVGMIAVGIFMG
jgi:hypothetical protein